jgi:RNA polymerase sigma-70 factor (ECF subfamily)
VNGDDAEALRAALRSDEPQHLRIFFDRHYDAMATLLRPDAGSEDDVDEIIRSVWQEAIASGDTIRNHESPRGFVFSFLLQHLGEVEETDEPDTVDDDDPFVPDGMPWAGHWEELPQPWGPETETWLRSDDGRRAVTAFLDSAPLVDRVLLVLRDMDGWSASDVTALTGLGADDQQAVLTGARDALHLAIDRSVRELA